MYLIKVKRDSVSMGDDIHSPHEYTFKLDGQACLNDVFTYLAKKRYLPKVHGNGHSWDVIFANQNVVHFIENQQTPEKSPSLIMPLTEFANEDTVDLFFTYNSASRE